MSCGRWPPLRNPSTSLERPTRFRVASVSRSPDKAQLARNRGGDHVLQFPPHGRACDIDGRVALGLPGYVSDWLAQLSWRKKEIATDTCLKPVAPCRLDQHAPRRAICPPPGDPALASRTSAGMFGRNETQIGHELARIGETGDVAEFPPPASPRPPARGHAALAAPSPLASAT